MNDFPWPPNYLEEYTARNRLLLKLNRDADARGLMQAFYKQNPIAWIEDWCITFDPRNVDPLPRIMPTVLFPRQKDLIQFLWECYLDRENGLAEKSRDMGASWIAVDFSAWLWLYYPQVAIGWGSRKEEYVDKKGDPKAILPKIRMVLQNLPLWMLPEGFEMDAHAPYMRIINPENGSTIVGEAGDNMGRGGRTSIYFKDESAHYERPELVEAALGDNTEVQIDISSVYGSGNVFYRRRHAGELWIPGEKCTPGKTRIFVMDWKDHPAKSQEWYDLRRKRATDEGLLHLFAQEVDRDYSAAMENVIIPTEWVRSAVDAHIKLGIPFEGETIAGQDVADGGGDKNALSIRRGITLFHASHWGGEAGDAARIAVPICVENGATELYYDSASIGTGFKVEINNMMEKPNWPRSLRVMPWNGGATVLNPEDHIIPGDRDSPFNKDQYGNLKAQSWFRLRTRFHKTHQMIHHGQVYPHSELISLGSKIPHLEQLMRELSQAVRKLRPNGQVIVDKQPQGTSSPNLADSTMQCYNPTRTLSILDVL